MWNFRLFAYYFYLAPEIIKRDCHDLNVDLWCLGILTFEFLTGKPPFEHKSHLQTKNNILSSDYDDSMLSLRAKEFVRGLLRRNPKERTPLSNCIKKEFILYHN